MTIQSEKLQKVLARAALGSRREMENAIARGQVTINGKVATIGDRVTLKDKITYKGQQVKNDAHKQRLRAIVYNKPEGEICSRKDPEDRPTVFRRLPTLRQGRWIAVGRLDFNTSGLLLFVSDGELANKLMHPSSRIEREYLVRVFGEVDDAMLDRLREGILLEDGPAKFTHINPTERQGSNQWFFCGILEGRNREVRRLWESQEVKVNRLKRVRYGHLTIPSYLKPGQWLELNPEEIKQLAQMAAVRVPKQRLKTSRDENQRLRRRERQLRRGGKPKPAPGTKKKSVKKSMKTKG